MSYSAGQILSCISGTRSISVAVVSVADGNVTLRCGKDWSFQAGREFTLDAEHLRRSRWAPAMYGQPTRVAA